MEPDCVVVSESFDIHALGVAKRLITLGMTVAVIESDHLSGSPWLTWAPDRATSLLPEADGEPIDISGTAVVWWRRVAPSNSKLTGDPAHLDLVANDTEEALRGILATRFGGAWVDDPGAMRRAENKLIQLDLARRLDLRAPQTLISQDPAAIREFAHRHKSIVGKVLRGTNKTPLMTVPIDMSIVSDDALRMCPTIFQEQIPGSRHLRVNVFGDAVLTSMIESEHLDWRPYPDNDIREVGLDWALRSKLLVFLHELGLTMGAFDLKLTPDGEPVFLEVNPQGQFLFLQARSGTDLVGQCARYLAKRVDLERSQRATDPRLKDRVDASTNSSPLPATAPPH